MSQLSMFIIVNKKGNADIFSLEECDITTIFFLRAGKTNYIAYCFYSFYTTRYFCP